MNTENTIMLAGQSVPLNLTSLRYVIKDENFGRKEVVSLVNRLRRLEGKRIAKIAARLAGEWGV